MANDKRPLERQLAKLTEQRGKLQTEIAKRAAVVEAIEASMAATDDVDEQIALSHRLVAAEADLAAAQRPLIRVQDEFDAVSDELGRLQRSDAAEGRVTAFERRRASALETARAFPAVAVEPFEALDVQRRSLEQAAAAEADRLKAEQQAVNDERTLLEKELIDLGADVVLSPPLPDLIDAAVQARAADDVIGRQRLVAAAQGFRHRVGNF